MADKCCTTAKWIEERPERVEWMDRTGSLNVLASSTEEEFYRLEVCFTEVGRGTVNSSLGRYYSVEECETEGMSDFKKSHPDVEIHHAVAVSYIPLMFTHIAKEISHG